MPAARSALALLLWGLALDLVDVRLGRVDVVPDVVGLALVVLALKDLSERLPGLARARQVAVAAAVLSLADAVHPLSTTTEVAGSSMTTMTAVGSPTGLWGLLAGLHEVAVALVLVLLCRAVGRAARESGATTVAEVFGRLVLWNSASLVVAVLLTALVTAVGEEVSDLGVVLWTVLVLGAALRVWTMARLWGLREGPPLAPARGADGQAAAAELPRR